MIKPLDGIRIVDFSNMLMAPYASQILGDMGADVIKIETPEGDPIRGIGPERHRGMGAMFLNVNRSKRSLVLDLKKADGHAAMIDLIKSADILLYNRRPHVMQRLALDYERIAKVNPRIVYAGLFGYGQSGPYAHKPAFDDLIQAAVAIPWLSHQVDGREPAYVPTAIIDRAVALWAVGQITAALLHQSRTGQGQRIDMPMFEMMASFVLADHLSGHTFEPPIGDLGYPRMLIPDRRPFRTRDGYLGVMIYTDRHWRSFFAALGREEEFDNDARFASMTTRTQNIAAIYAELADLLRTKSNQEWLALFEETDIPAMPLQSLETLIEDKHLQATGFFSWIDHPSEGRLREMAVPAEWSVTQPGPTRPVPRLGEHSAEVLREIGYSDERIAALVESGVTSNSPAGTGRS